MNKFTNEDDLEEVCKTSFPEIDDLIFQAWMWHHKAKKIIKVLDQPEGCRAVCCWENLEQNFQSQDLYSLKSFWIIKQMYLYTYRNTETQTDNDRSIVEIQQCKCEHVNILLLGQW
jgi:hypothetical protein